MVWLRRDLRLHDHAAISAALKTGQPIVLAFVFDRDILAALPRQDRRVSFIHASLIQIDTVLRQAGSGLYAAYGVAEQEIIGLADKVDARQIFAARDFEPLAIARDEQVARQLSASDRQLTLVNDQTLHTPGSILTGSGKPYTVFTPFKKNFLQHLSEDTFADLGPDLKSLKSRLLPGQPEKALPRLAELGFDPCNLEALNVNPGVTGGAEALQDFSARIDQYDRQRDYPGIKGVSYLSVHLRFGTVSIRQAARLAQDKINTSPDNPTGAQTWLSELLWRDFYFQILHHFPHVTDAPFKPEYNRIQWLDDERLFKAWCDGQTGYPLIDAAMAQINQTGYMHNRLRMIVASFLTKDLGIHWQRGEAYFATHLNDFDLASNNGGWQWAASSGCDAQPYFRIFNPVTQSERFDPRGRFIRKYLPQLKALSDKQIHAPWLVDEPTRSKAGVHLGKNYPAPLVDHAIARQQTLARYAVVKADREPPAAA